MRFFARSITFASTRARRSAAPTSPERQRAGPTPAPCTESCHRDGVRHRGALPAPRPSCTSTTSLPTALLCASAIALSLPACERTTITQPLSTNYAPGDVGAALEFQEAMTTRSAVSNDEGLHAVIELALSGDQMTSYPQRVALAKQEGWLDPDFDEPADLAMQRGTLARAICVALHIKGGLIMQTFGPSGRYATRELVDARIFPEGVTSNQTITGLELVGTLGRARDFVTIREVAEAARNAPPPPPAPPEEPAAPPAVPDAPAPAATPAGS